MIIAAPPLSFIFKYLLQINIVKFNLSNLIIPQTNHTSSNNFFHNTINYSVWVHSLVGLYFLRSPSGTGAILLQSNRICNSIKFLIAGRKKDRVREQNRIKPTKNIIHLLDTFALLNI